MQGDPDSPLLASPTLVPEINPPPGASPTDSSQTTGSAPPAPISDSTSRGGVSPLNVLDVVKQSLRSAGLSADAAGLAALGRRTSTRRTYDS